MAWRLMPIPASALGHEPYVRLLMLSWPKRGATTHAIATSPGPVRVLLCESTDSALEGASQETKAFDFERVTGWDTMSKYLIEAKREAKDGKIKTVVVDPLNFFADKLMEECFGNSKTENGKEDGRKAHPEFTRRITHTIDLLLTIPAHIIVVNHFMMEGGGEDNNKPKVGEGIVPLMPNLKSRSMVAAKFHNVAWFDFAQGTEEHHNNRVFVVSATGRGVMGPGLRSLQGKHVIPAHVGQFLKAIAEARKNGVAPRAVANGAPKPMVAAPKPQAKPMVRR
jgi:hypothetical protein